MVSTGRGYTIIGLTWMEAGTVGGFSRMLSLLTGSIRHSSRCNCIILACLNVQEAKAIRLYGLVITSMSFAKAS